MGEVAYELQFGGRYISGGFLTNIDFSVVSTARIGDSLPDLRPVSWGEQPLVRRGRGALGAGLVPRRVPDRVHEGGKPA
jgi:hypothetical protein